MKRLSIPGLIGLALCLLHISGSTHAQKYKSTSSTVHFFSDAPMEDIEATNSDGQSAFDVSTGEIVFSIPIKSFQFEKSLMQEHFNENYMESDKYPHATFKGTVKGYDPTSETTQTSEAQGILSIHGVENEITVEGTILLNEDEIEINAKFPVRLKDHKIKIPKVVFYNIAEVVDVTIKFSYEKID